MKLLFISLLVAAQSGSALAGPTAEELYSQGQSAYDRADYTTAVVKWRLSYHLSAATGLLFNLAQAHRLGGDCTRALSIYKRFIELDPKAEQRPLADDFVRELEPSCGATTPPRIDLVQQQVENTRSAHNMKLAALVTGGTGAALVATGLLFGSRASTLADEVTGACSVSCDWAMLKDKDATGHRDAKIGYALDVFGLAAIAGGAVMYYLGDRESTVTVSPRSRDGGVVVSWSSTW